MKMDDLVKYKLLGYYIPDDRNSQALLYDHKRNQFKLKECLATSEHFRSCFLNNIPPLPYSFVYENVHNGFLQEVERSNVTIYEIPHTVLSINELMAFSIDAKPNMKDNLPLWDKMSEKKFVLENLFMPSCIWKLRSSIIDYFGFKKIDNIYIPNDINHLFIHLEKVDINKWIDEARYQPDTVIQWQKIIKHVIEDVCPFVKVALFDNLNLEKALMLCLPTGSTGKGKEIFFPTNVILDNEIKMSNDLTWNSVTVNRSGEVVKKEENNKFVLVPDDSLFLNTSNERTHKYYNNQAVVYLECKKKNVPFATFDFTNFYANIAINFQIDDFITKVLLNMIKMRKYCVEIKSWIVTLIGKMKHYDTARYTRLKKLSVAIILSTINKNSNVCGATTDGILINLTEVKDIHNIKFDYPAGFPVKLEFMPSEQNMVWSINANTYAAINYKNEIVHRGFISRLNYSCPKWYRKYIDIIIEHCLLCEFQRSQCDIESIKKKLDSCLKTVANNPRSFALKDYGQLLSANTTELPVVEMYLNDLNTGILQFYTTIDDTILPWGYSSENVFNNALPQTLNGWCLKSINAQSYTNLMRDKLKKLVTRLSITQIV